MLIDKCSLILKAGNGGNGIISWRKEAHYPEGGPWGGDGGKGGDIYIIGDHNINSLIDLRYKKVINAENGENGGTKLCHGKNGEDKIIKVPVGTSIFDIDKNELIVDILETGQKYLICKGGQGGKGNFYFKSSKNRVPNLCENGDLGENKNIRMELKYIADVGLLGLPNAGKSTLINSLSNAKLKTANYPFTTLSPSLAVVEFLDEKLVFADIPGLIKNASKGQGLGFEFLKHIERCHFLIHLISVSQNDTSDPFEDYLTILEELKNYDASILNKRIYVVLNKIDELESNEIIDEFIKKYNSYNNINNNEIFTISGLNKINVNLLLDKIFKCYKEYKDIWKDELTKKINSYSLVKVTKNDEDVISISKDENGFWIVDSKRISYWCNKIPFNTQDNIVRFMQKVKMNEIEELLKEKGASIGDTFKMGSYEFEIG